MSFVFNDAKGKKDKWVLMDCFGHYEFAENYESAEKRLAELEEKHPNDEWEKFPTDDETEWTGYPGKF